MSEWKEVKLGEIARSNQSTYSPKDNWKFANYLDTGNITENRISKILFIDLMKEDLPSRARRKVRKNSIIYSTVRPNQKHFGIIKNIPENFLVSTGFSVLDVDESKANPDFVYYSLIQEKNTASLQAVAEQSTSAYPAIKPSDIENLPIKLPPLAEQKRIAEILGSLDDKIELNNRINRNLEEQASALFNKAYDEAETQASFTDIISISSGGTPKTSEASFWKGQIPFFTPKDVGYPYALTTEKYITENGLNNCNSKLYPANTTFITARGTVGKLSLAAVPMAMNQSCFALVSKSLPPSIIYMYAARAVRGLKKKSNGAVFDAITIKDFETEIINKLSDEKISSIASVIEPIFSKIQENTFEIQHLIELRDTLLPKLMSGEEI